MDSFTIPNAVIWSLIGALLMIINGLLWQKINSFEKANKEITEKLLEMENIYFQKLDETRTTVQISMNEILKAIHKLEIKIIKDFVNKEDCEKMKC